MDGFPARHLGARLAIGRRQCAPVPSGRAPGPSRTGFLYIKSGAAWSLQQWCSKQQCQSSGEASSSCRCSVGTKHSQPSRELRGLPSRTMRGSELSLLLLALVLCQAPRGPAAPVSTGAGGGTVLAKMYPRGSHWAVGKCPYSEIPGLFSSEGLTS